MAMKWLRKHNKKILVVGGAFLMVAFLMPRQDGCRGRARAKDYPIAQAFGKTITLNEVRSAALELAILQGIRLPRPVADPMDYVLLLKEARQMRVPAGPEVVTEGIATTVAKMNEVSTLAQLAAKLAGQQRLNFTIDEKLLRRVLANFISVTRAQELILGRPGTIPREDGQVIRDYRSALGLAQSSDKELELVFRDFNEQVDVEYVAFPACRYASKVSAPTDSEILTQFEAYKDEYSGSADNEFGFGYKQPLLLKLEYIKLDLEKVKAQLERPSPETVRQYYDKHKQLYVLRREDAGEAEPDTEAQAPEYKPFDQVYKDVESRCLEEQAQAKAVEIIGEARRLAKARWEQLKREQKDAPISPASLYPYAGEQQESLVNWLNEKFQVSAEYGRTGWIDAEQAESLPGIGASYSRTQPGIAFLQIASMVRQPGTGAQEAGPMSFELGQDCRVNMLDAQGNLYLFRVIGLRREEILDADQMLADQRLRRKVAADLLARRAYEYALEQAHKLFGLAQQQGLEGALSEFADKDLEIRQAGMISRGDSGKAAKELLIPLVDSAGKTRGQVHLKLQMAQFRGPQESLPINMGTLQMEVTNKSPEGRITALGMSLPRYLRTASRAMRPIGGNAAALNGGESVPAGPEGYSVRYFAGGIDAGRAGKFDLLISARSQELTNSSNLSEAGIEPEQSEQFQFLLPQGLSARAIDFARGPRPSSPDMVAMDSAMVARLEKGSETQLLRGIFPANRQDQFLRGCFVVLDNSTLQRKPAEPPESKPEEQTGELQAPADDELAEPRTPDLITESVSGQPPCALIEVPRRRLCYVISAGKHLPLSRAQFRQHRQALLNVLTRDQHEFLVRSWCNSSSIRSRTGYRDLQAQQKAPQTDQAPTQTPDEDSP